MIAANLRVAGQRQCQLMPHLRLGQAVFNLAHLLYPYPTSRLVGTELDPFYDDSRVEAFLKELELQTSRPGIDT